VRAPPATKRILTILLGLGILGVTAVTAVPLLWPLIPRATIFAPMAPQCAALGLLLAGIALIGRRRKLAALSLVVAVWNGQLIWPDVSPFRAVSPAAAGQPVLKVLNFNIRFKNRNLDAVADYLIASGADVIGLIEATPRSKAALARLKTVYPYSIDCVGMELDCQNMLFSKLPLKKSYAGPIDGRYPYIAMAEVGVPGASPVTIGVTHLSTPFTKQRAPLGPVDPALPAPRLAGAPDLEQSHQAANLAGFLQRQPADFVLLGDFNSAPWSPLQQAFRTVSGLDDRGHFLPSWPTSVWPIFRISLDQVFVRGRVQVTQLRLGPDIGSDHLPVVAEIAISQ
jgi:endonuclease/exonuclease/phosphatase (EEP) superfamily protein YafD